VVPSFKLWKSVLHVIATRLGHVFGGMHIYYWRWFEEKEVVEALRLDRW
jgi:hypothetical protein